MPCTILSTCRLSQVLLANLVSSKAVDAHRTLLIGIVGYTSSAASRVGELRGVPPFAVMRLPETACVCLVVLCGVGKLRPSGLLDIIMGRSGADYPTAGRCGMLFVTDVRSEQLLFAGITPTHARPLLSQELSGVLSPEMLRVPVSGS